MEKKEPEKENAVVVRDEKVLNPEEQVDFAQKAAKVLQDVVRQAKLVKNINGNDYMMFEGWQTVAKFYGATVGIESTKVVKGLTSDEILAGNKQEHFIGFEARAYVKDKQGNVISTAESYCGRDEHSWNERKRYDKEKKEYVTEKVPVFALRSMAQTRASAKALRQVYSWVVVLAGYKPTPIEEMDGLDLQNEPKKSVEPKTVKGTVQNEYKCHKCGKKISEKVYKYSIDMYRTALCMDHQKELKEQMKRVVHEPEEEIEQEEVQ